LQRGQVCTLRKRSKRGVFLVDSVVKMGRRLTKGLEGDRMREGHTIKLKKKKPGRGLVL